MSKFVIVRARFKSDYALFGKNVGPSQKIFRSENKQVSNVANFRFHNIEYHVAKARECSIAPSKH